MNKNEGPLYALDAETREWLDIVAQYALKVADLQETKEGKDKIYQACAEVFQRFSLSPCTDVIQNIDGKEVVFSPRFAIIKGGLDERPDPNP
tara:strand:- start:5360 stop:5635 length:276 start_codon:yes stop_codon:yes gene_type:complete